MHIFFSPDLSGTNCTLPDDETHHLIHVLRLTRGDKVQVTDGCGTMAICEIVQLSKKSAALNVIEKVQFPAPLRKLHVAIAPTKNIDRFEWFVEKATEIGISRITPLLCHHSERKILNTGRVKKLVVAAAKQSRQYLFPVLNEMVSFDLLMKQPFAESKFIAHCQEGVKVQLSTLQMENDALIVIGPEGDFTPQEVQQALEVGFVPLSLGLNRLRTETAGLVAVAAFNR